MPALVNPFRIAAAILLCCLFVFSAVAKKKPPAIPININTANSEQLQQVPGIGPATAEKILQMRKSYGAFKTIDDLLAVRGLGPKRLEKMRKYLTVGKSPAAKHASASTKPPPQPSSSPSPPPAKPPATPVKPDEEPPAEP